MIHQERVAMVTRRCRNEKEVRSKGEAREEQKRVQNGSDVMRRGKVR